jgi:hypothetical protein
MAAMAAIAVASLSTRSFIESVSWAVTRPWCRLPVPRSFLLAAFVSEEHENRPDSGVGRLHYSLGPTLSAQFRWSVGASERLDFSCQYVSTTKRADYRQPRLIRSIRHLTYLPKSNGPLDHVDRGRFDPQIVAEQARIHRVMLGGRRVCAHPTTEPDD